jgi:hypothetical protein
MVLPVRGIFTLVGVATAGFLIWLSTQFGQSVGAYWAKIGLLAGAGLALPLSQLFGGWTKWGWPRFSGDVLLLGFLPALIAAGWVILSGQPDDNWFQRHVTSWSGDLHAARLVRHLRETYLDVLAFGLGAVFGFSFDTTGPRAATRPVRVGGPGEGVPGEPGSSPAAPPRGETAVTRVAEAPSEAETRVTPPQNPPTES